MEVSFDMSTGGFKGGKGAMPPKMPEVTSMRGGAGGAPAPPMTGFGGHHALWAPQL